MIKNFNLIACCDLDNGIGLSLENDLPWFLPNEYQYFQFVTQRLDNDLGFLERFKSDKAFNDLNENERKFYLQDSRTENEKINAVNQVNTINTINDKEANKTKQELLFGHEDLNTNGNQTKVDLCELCNCIIMGRNTWQSLGNYRPLKNRLNLVLSRTFDSSTLNINDDYLFKNLEDALMFASKLIFVNEIFVVGGEQVYRQAIEMNECKKIYLTRINARFNCDRFFPAISERKFKEIDEFGLKDRIQLENNLKYEFHIYKRI